MWPTNAPWCGSELKPALTAARKRRRTGRCPKLTPDQRSEVLDTLAAGRTAAEVVRIFRVHRATISRLAAQARATQLL
jgi:DNA invertase Pin-like site-specific DNA recombinase